MRLAGGATAEQTRSQLMSAETIFAHNALSLAIAAAFYTAFGATSEMIPARDFLAGRAFFCMDGAACLLADITGNMAVRAQDFVILVTLPESGRTAFAAVKLSAEGAFHIVILTGFESALGAYLQMIQAGRLTAGGAFGGVVSTQHSAVFVTLLESHPGAFCAEIPAAFSA